MNKHRLVKVLAAMGIAATVVTSTQVANNDDSDNVIQAAESKTSHYKYRGDTGFGNGDFLTNDALIKSLEEDGTIAFNGHDIKASEDDYKTRADKKSEFVEEHDQKFTLRDGTATKVIFPIKDEELPIEDIVEAYGDDYEVIENKKEKFDIYVYKLGDQKDDAKKNVIAFKVEDDYVTEGIIGYAKSYK